MMDVITLLALDFFHRVIAGHGCLTWADHWIEINVRRAFEVIFGEELAIDLNAQLVVQLADFDALVFRGAESPRNQHHSRGPKQSIGHRLNVKSGPTQVKADPA